MYTIFANIAKNKNKKADKPVMLVYIYLGRHTTCHAT